MKQTQQRLIRIRYGFRCIRRPKAFKKRSKKAQLVQSTQPCRQPNTSPSQTIETSESAQPTITTVTTTPLAHFDLTCNPYQQFIDNVCQQLPYLPRDTFTKTPASSLVDTKAATSRQADTAHSPPKPSHTFHPSLHDLSNIPSCMLVSKH